MLPGMGDWNEETLRKAASWKAFKEGEALWRDGWVTRRATLEKSSDRLEK